MIFASRGMPRGAFKSREEFKTRHSVFDEFTNRTIYKLISEGYFEGLESPLFIGKESNVFTALKKDGTRVIVKIYRLETCDFNRMYDYIKGDPRYANIKKRRRNVVFAWVQREYRNLMIARDAQVPVPLAMAFMNNALVLECIASHGEIAHKLKDEEPKHPKEFFTDVIEGMRRLHKAGLVHGDLSPFNILNREDKPVFIDFSQAAPLDHSQAKEFLERDIRNVCKYFISLGVKVNGDKTKALIIKQKQR
jgi:RIO kinase 1